MASCSICLEPSRDTCVINNCNVIAYTKINKKTDRRSCLPVLIPFFCVKELIRIVSGDIFNPDRETHRFFYIWNIRLACEIIFRKRKIWMPRLEYILRVQFVFVKVLCDYDKSC